MSLYMIVNLFSLALIQVRDGEATPIAGQYYTLMCDSSWANIGAYQWRKDSTVLSERGSTLSFSPLSLSDAGHYTCTITVNSVNYSDNKYVVVQSNKDHPDILCVHGMPTLYLQSHLQCLWL